MPMPHEPLTSNLEEICYMMTSTLGFPKDNTTKGVHIDLLSSHLLPSRPLPGFAAYFMLHERMK